MLTIISISSEKNYESEYVIYLLRNLRTLSKQMIACVSSGIESELLSSINIHVDQIFTYDTAIDANRWQDVIVKKMNRTEMGGYSRLLLVNDSMFGPLFPLDALFERNDLSLVDFWGMTDHGDIEINYFGNLKSTWPRFLQKYFIVINDRLLKSQDFYDFFERLPIFDGLNDEAEQFEFVFTNYFEVKNYSWKTVIETRKLENEDLRYFMSFIIYDIYHLIKDYRFPFLPKVLFEIDQPTMLAFNNGNDLSRVLSYIDNNTDYDSGLIYKNILPRMNLHDILTRLNLHYIIEEKAVDNPTALTVGAFFYLFYEDLFDYAIERILEVQSFADIYIATNTKDKIRIITQKLEDNILGSKINIILHEGRGRDLSALLITFHPYLMDYDLVCFVHDKKSGQLAYSTLGQAFNECLWENTLHNRNYVYGIIKTFEREPYLGFLSPPMVSCGTYFHTSIDSWTTCFDEAKKIADLLGVDVLLDRKKNPIAFGSVFWCRTLALKRLFRHSFHFEDFPDEPMPVDGTFSHGLERIFPYIAQSEGFYSGIVMNSEYASSQYNNQFGMLNSILSALSKNSRVNTNTTLDTIKTISPSNRWKNRVSIYKSTLNMLLRKIKYGKKTFG